MIAGAGSGKTEVMARRIAWWLAVEGADKGGIVAFTFTERAADEMKFRIRRHVQAITPEGEDATLGDMYVGTIHGFCLRALRELRPDRYHNFDVIDEAARHALVQRGYYGILGLSGLQSALGSSQLETIELFCQGYDLLNEYAALDVQVPAGDPPHTVELEREWCKLAALRLALGTEDAATAFGTAAARFYAYLLCRRFLDFSTSQFELVRLLRTDQEAASALRAERTHIVVDEVQDVNAVQKALIDQLVGDSGRLTAVGDHRQAIYRFRGSQVKIMASLAADFTKDPHARVYELTKNYRSTRRIIDLANEWAATIGQVGNLPSPPMEHGNQGRNDRDTTHVSLVAFPSRQQEATWIARTINSLVDSTTRTGASHDYRGSERGLTLSDVAILLRSSTDARCYMRALEDAGIPAVVRAGPDLFGQPEVLLVIGALARAVDLDEFRGATWGTGLPARIADVLGCNPKPDEVIQAAARVLRASGLQLRVGLEDHILLVADAIAARLRGQQKRVAVSTPGLAAWLSARKRPRRVFPQQVFQWLLGELDVQSWDSRDRRSAAAMFHLGQLSQLVAGIETPGWTSTDDFKYQVIGLCLWGTDNARTEEAPLLVPPDAVTITTIHSAKGLEFPIVFLADVCSRRFPSNRARTVPNLPFGDEFSRLVDLQGLADNANYDDERRLMYVALTRAERFLFVSKSGSQRSAFWRDLETRVPRVGGSVSAGDLHVAHLNHCQQQFDADAIRLVTSFSELRYYLECSHDFYLRKILGFAPTIDQAFGYGRGVHNIMRAIHSDPKRWAALAKDAPALRGAIQGLIEQGLLYLRYTTGEPRDNMQKKAVDIVTDYVVRFASELERLRFEPEREFETLLDEEDVLISGAIDVIRLDDPPRVTLIDFKSGDVKSDVSTKLDEEEMKLQVSLYGLAAKRELEIEPERGLVRYLGEPDPSKSELDIPLDDAALSEARQTVVRTARLIRDREFFTAPTGKPRDPRLPTRCAECDFCDICGMEEARRYRKTRHKA